MAHTAAQRRQILRKITRLHADGKSLREISRQLDLAPSTISRMCAKAGIEFDRAQTRAATKARLADAAAWRAETVLDLLSEADRAIRRMDEPLTIPLRGPDGIEMIHLDQPRPEDLRNLATVAGVALDKAAGLLTRDVIDDASDAIAEQRSLMSELIHALEEATSTQDDGYGSEYYEVHPAELDPARPAEVDDERH